jgi:hypothetical protein
MPDLTIARPASPEHAEDTRYEELVAGLRRAGLTVELERRSSTRGALTDVLLYLGAHLSDATVDLILEEIMRSFARRRESAEDASRRFVLIDETGAAIREVELP